DLAARLAALREAAECLATDVSATATQRDMARAALDLPADPERLIDLGALRARGVRAATYEEARKGVEQAALELGAGRDVELLQELLDLFAASYEAGKERESALDFEDLQLLARDLLAGDERVRETERLRFRALMVDEFQDTNALQCDVVDFLAGGAEKEVFYVGDEFQSIYGFRHADVEVFRERRVAASQRLPLTQNYRSRPEVLAAVNHLFGPEFGYGFQPLAASGEFPDPGFGHPVELLVTDKASRSGTGGHVRRGRAGGGGGGGARRAPRARAGRSGRSDTGRDRAAVRGGHRRRVVRGGAACARAADAPRDRPPLLRPAAGGRPPPLPASPAEPL